MQSSPVQLVVHEHLLHWKADAIAATVWVEAAYLLPKTIVQYLP